MPPLIVHSSSAGVVQSKPFVLNEGQMFHGQIKQLFPGQMAEVQIGGQKLFAKLEVPMKAGDSYYFQVHTMKPELQLKIIAGPLGESQGQGRQLSSLMDAMQLPKNPEMQSLLSFIMKNKIPMSREGLLQAETMLKSVPTSMKNEALASIQKMVELQLPFNETVFRSLFGVESKEGFHTVLTTLREALAGDLSVTSQVRESILSALNTIEKPLAQVTGGAILGQALMSLLDSSERPENRFATLQLLKNAGMLPVNTSLANLLQVLKSLQANGVQENGQKPIVYGRAPINDLPMPLSTEGQDLLRLTAEKSVATPFQSDAGGNGPKEQLLALLGQRGQPDVLEKLSSLVRGAERSDNPAIEKLLQSAETAVASAVDSKAVRDAIQTVIRSLGLHYEAGIIGKDADIIRLAEALKPQLIALMQDSSVSQAVRESAELVVMRMNGPLLLSGDNGVQHQLVMQVPLEFFGKRIDTTLQWNGRMKKDGKIDSDFARILFYLDLHSIEKTIIDMQVQNRIVSLTVFNSDETLSSVGAPLQQMLKQGLESVGYKLSGIDFKNYTEDEKSIQPNKSYGNAEGKGVDFRI